MRKLELEIKQLDEPDSRQESVFLKYTSPFLVFLQQDVQRPAQIIARLGQILMDKGYAETGYSESALMRESMSFTTIGEGLRFRTGIRNGSDSRL